MEFDVRCGVALRPAADFTSCGDQAIAWQHGRSKLFAVIDALGHGPDAAKSATKVRDTLSGAKEASLAGLFRAADKCLSGQRGAVMSAIRVEGAEVVFAGIGNVDIYGPEGSPRPACRPGTLGRGIVRFREEKLVVNPGDRWVLATDGIRARDVRRVLGEVAGLKADAAAEALVARAGRPDDDVGVLVLDFAAASP